MNILPPPPHPGDILTDKFIHSSEGRRIDSVASLARKLGFTRGTLNRIIHSQKPISPKMALALESIGSIKAEEWLYLQIEYDLYQLRNMVSPTIEGDHNDDE